MKKSLMFLIISSVIVFTAFSFINAATITERLSGMILLQVEENGEAWYLNPDNSKRYFLGRPADAFEIMRSLGLGIEHTELTQYLNTSFPGRLSGKILLDVEMNGEAYYVYPEDLEGYYLGRPADAFEIMRSLGLGITNSDLGQITNGSQVSTEINNQVVDTNQSICYNNNSNINCPSSGADFYGQDAQYQGTQPSYTDNGDGTVTDNITGLIWLQDAGDKVNYYDGVNAADTFSYAGYDDWRVPSIKELYSLMDFSGQDVDPMSSSASTPFINDNVFVFEYGNTSQGDRIIDSQWVTSNVYVDDVFNNQECFFGVNFADGRIKCYPTQVGKGYFLRYVRGNQSYGINDFVNNNNGTVTDNSSGLIWQQSDSGQSLNWADALEYCENLNLAGSSDWRLPNAKELEYIVDYSRSPDTTSSPAINSIFNTTSIINEAGQNDYPFFWTSTTHVSARGGQSAVYISFGRALGYMNGHWMDVHGAGAQRSDPKVGDPNDYPYGHGPQGDAIRIYNYVRCLR